MVKWLESAPARAKHTFRRLKTSNQKFIKSLRPFVKPVIIVFAILIIGTLSLFRANFNYIDDLSRSFYGMTGWENFSRHLTNFLAQLLHLNTVLTDTSPLPQLLALAIMSISGVMLLYILTNKRKFSWIELVLAAMLALNPYFLECLSYKFDAPYIALSVFFAILPFVFLKKSLKHFTIVSFFCIVGICTTYQVSLAIYPMIAVVLALRQWSERESYRQIFRFLAFAVLGFVLGVLFFKFFLLIKVDSYVSASLPALDQIIPNTLRNFAQYYSNVRQDLRIRWLILIITIAIGFVCAIVQRSLQPKVPAVLLSLLACLLLAGLCFGVYPLFEKPLFDPRAMYGFTAMVVILGIFAVNCGWRLPHAAFCLVTAVLGWSFLNLSFTYGNALAYQQEYVDFRNELILSELNTLPAVVNATEPFTLRLVGDQPYSVPANQTAIEQYPVLRRLIPEYGRGDWMWGYYKLEHYYDLPYLRMQPSSPDFDPKTCPVLRDTAYFTFCGTKQEIMVILK